jgi:hypothetical protein
MQPSGTDQALLELNLAAEVNDEDRATSSQEPPVDDAVTAAVAATKRIVWVQETEADAAEAAREKTRKEKAISSTDTTPPSTPAITSSTDKAEPVQPAATDAAATEPAVTQPAGTQPAVTQVPAIQPQAAEPAKSETGAVSSVRYTGKLRAVEITIGDSDYQFTHVKSGNLKSGDDVVVGIKPPGAP